MLKVVIEPASAVVSVQNCSENKIYVSSIDDVLYKLCVIDEKYGFVSLEDTSETSINTYDTLQDALEAEIEEAQAEDYDSSGVYELKNGIALAKWMKKSIKERGI